MARSNEKATKARVSSPKSVPPKRRAGSAAKSAKQGSAKTAVPAKANKRTDSSAKNKKTAQATPAASKPLARKAAPKAPKAAPKAAKAAGPAKAKAAPAPQPDVSKKRKVEAPPAAAPPAAPRPKPIAARTIPPPPPATVDKQAEMAAKAERQLEQRQTELYEKAVEFFNARKFSRALPLLEKAAEGPNAALRHRAHVYAEICGRQISAEKVDLKTAEDHYNYAVKLMNDRRLEDAERHLQKALRLEPKAGYVHYANAVLSALRGNPESAFGNLKRAIEIDPQNRVLALNDADLGSVMSHPPIAQLLHQGGER